MGHSGRPYLLFLTDTTKAGEVFAVWNRGEEPSAPGCELMNRGSLHASGREAGLSCNFEKPSLTQLLRSRLRLIKASQPPEQHHH